MADKIAAAQTIRQLATLFEGMVAAANTLDECGSLENAVIEATQAKDAAVAARDAAIAEMETALVAVKAAKNDADKIIADAQADAATIKANAEADAAAITQSAKEQAYALVADAKQKADKSITAAQAHVDLLDAQLERLRSSIRQAETLRYEADADAIAAEARLAQAKEAIKKLMAE